MFEGETMKYRKIGAVLCLIATIAVLGYKFWLMKGNANPYSPNHIEASKTVENFYEAYKKGIDGTIPYLYPSDAAFLANYRFYYGEIQNYEIVSIENSNAKLKKATVRVKTKKNNTGEIIYTDTLLLRNVEDRWLIVKYTTDSTKDWPTLP